MISRKNIYIVSTATFLLLAIGTLAYDNLIIHPALTDAATKIYNSQANKKITQEQINWIVEGSIAEDTDPRYLNHFYNPSTGQGLNDAGFSGMASKEWAKKQNSVSGDYSESAILKNYREGNFKRAYQGIGHIAHLIQDMAVPAHTRNDAHPEGDVYEKWAEDYGKINISRANFAKIDSLDQAFDATASYTHNNFFSKDTIDSSILDKIQEYKTERDINGKEVDYGYYDKYKIIRIIKHREWNEYLFDFRVHLDYWNLLHPKAVGYSAGVIDYFVRQFKEIDKEKQAEEQKLGLWGNLWNKTKNVAAGILPNSQYVFGDSFLAARVRADNGGAAIIGIAKNTAKNLGFFTEASKEVAVDTAKKSVNVASSVISSVKNPIKAEDLFKAVQTSAAPASKVLGVKITPSALDENPPDPLYAKGAEVDGGGSTSDHSTDSTSLPQISPAPEGEQAGQTETAPTASAPAPKLTTPIFIAGDSTPPDTIIQTAPSTFTNQTSASFSFSSTEDGASFLCQLDPADGGAGWQTCASGITYANLADGAHIFKVKASDNAGNIDQIPAEASWTVDTTPSGNALINLLDTDSSSNNYTNSQAVNAEITNDTDAAAWMLSETQSTQPSATDAAWLAARPTSFQLSAGNGDKKVYVWTKDNLDNVSDQGYYAQIALDTTAPIVAINTKPTNPTNLSSAQLEFSSEAGSTFACKLDNSEWQSCSSPQNYADLAGGSHTFSAKATDAAGNVGEATNYSWEIDLSIPATPTVSWPAAFPYYASSTPITANGVNTSGLTVLINNSTSTVETLTSTTWQAALNLVEGENVFSLKSRDRFGVESGTSNFSVVLDTTAPISTIDNLAAEHEATGFTVNWSGSDPSAGSGLASFDAEYKIDTGSWQTWQSATSATSSVFSEAVSNSQTIYFRARARDNAGNIGGWSAEAQTTINNHLVNYVVVSEIQVAGGTANDEFIELYNPTASATPLSGYKLKRKSSSGVEYYLVSSFGSAEIAPYGYYLIAHPSGYTGSVAADITYTSSSYSVASDNTVILYNGETIIDKVGFGAAGDYEGSPYPANPAAGESLERKAHATSTAETMAAGGAHQNAGNGYDSGNNNNDFVLLTSPEPQNAGGGEAAAASSPVTVDSTSSATNPVPYQSSITWSHTVSGSDVVLLVFVHSLGGTQSANWVTYGGVNLTQATTTYPRLYYLANPPSGANNIIISYNIKDFFTASAISLNNCDTTDPIGLLYRRYAQSTHVLDHVTTTVDNMMLVDAVTINTNQDYAIAADDGQTAYGTYFSPYVMRNFSTVASHKAAPTAGVYPMGWTQAYNQTWAHAIVGVRPKPNL